MLRGRGHLYLRITNKCLFPEKGKQINLTAGKTVKELLYEEDFSVRDDGNFVGIGVGFGKLWTQLFQRW
jgi:hypothetical protein